MKEVIEKYMSEVSPMQKGHRRNLEIAPHFCDLFGDSLVSEVTTSRLSSYKAKRLTGEIIYGRGRGKRAGESTVKKEFAFLRTVFNKAINEWHDDWSGWFKVHPENPVKAVIKGLTDRKRVRYVLSDEAERLAVELRQSELGCLREFVIVGCQTGMREGNIVNLLVSQCDFKNGLIIKPGEEMKGGEPFAIKMTSAVRETLQGVIRSRRLISPFVFTDGQGKPYTVNAVSMSFRRACKRAKVADLRFHDLRHDFATLLINSGASLYQVQHALSHADPRMTQRYAHLLPENRDVVDRIEGEGMAAALMRVNEKSGSYYPATTRKEKQKRLQAATP
ncbi:MAG TPA: site-specific integrase [Thermodesulfovibrionales bacterium]|nr:site-specific integrase [Thermodesulfovibrionales bacterium]